MFVAAVGKISQGSWKWAVLMAVGLEAAMLVTPYTRYFGIPLSTKFVIVTLTAHLIFGIAMAAVSTGLTTRFNPFVRSAEAVTRSN
jgi:hypothetical protein